MNKHEQERDRLADNVGKELLLALTLDRRMRDEDAEAIANIAKKAFAAGWDTALIHVGVVTE